MASYIHCGPSNLPLPEIDGIKKSLASNLAKAQIEDQGGKLCRLRGVTEEQLGQK